MENYDSIRKDHGIGVGKVMQPTDLGLDPQYHTSDAEAVQRDHGVGLGRVMQPTDLGLDPQYHTSDAEAVQRDHGVGLGRVMQPTDLGLDPLYHTTDAEAVQRDHGVGLGREMDPLEVWGTKDEKEKHIINEIIHAQSVKNVEELITSLPDQSVVKILEQRFRKTANKLEDTYGLTPATIASLGQNIDLDMQIIIAAIKAGRNFNLNVENHLGKEEIVSLDNLTKAYEDALNSSNVDAIAPLLANVQAMKEKIAWETFQKSKQVYDEAERDKISSMSVQGVEQNIEISGPKL